jgi:drug/metabolite transporter (DMT)-like permease
MFGIWPVVGALAMRDVPPMVLIGVRLLVSGPLLFALTRPWRAGMTGQEVLACAGLGFLGVTANQLLFVHGLSHAGPINAAILGCLIPAWTLLFAIALKKEQAAPTRLGGIGLAMLGALTLVGADQLELGGERALGNLMLVGNTAVYSAYLVLARPLLAKYGAMPVVGWAFLFSSVQALPVVVPSLLATDWQSLPLRVWAAFAYVVFGASLLAYGLNAWALRVLSASTVAVFVYLQPLITGVASGKVLGQLPGWQALLAGSLIFAGVALVSRPVRSKVTAAAFPPPPQSRQ